MLAKTLLVDVTRIHPDDRLGEDLGLNQVDALEGVHLLGDIEDGFRLKFDDDSVESVETVRDLVRLIPAYRAAADRKS